VGLLQFASIDVLIDLSRLKKLNPFKGRRRTCCALILILTLSGCTSMVSSMTSRMAEDLADTILNSQDVETVREGVPAYLLMIDSFLRSSPDDPDLLLAASNLNGAFSVFTGEERAKLLTAKSLEYALHAACIEQAATCGFRDLGFEAFQGVVDALGADAVPVLYAIGVAWTGWLQAHSDDWNAIAQLGKVKYLVSRVIELDETWENGGPHLYMGGLETVLPASMGGNPEKGREHFEQAIELSGGNYLMTKVIYAEQYARMIFDKDLHDRLLGEVLEADPVQPGMTLTNMVARQRAQALLDDSDEYF
jgi:hypothetical protein